MASLAASSYKMFIWSFLSSWDHGSVVVWPELVITCGGEEIRDISLCKDRFSFHQSSSALDSQEGLTSPSKDLCRFE